MDGSWGEVCRESSMSNTPRKFLYPFTNGMSMWNGTEPFIQHNCLQIPSPDPEDIHSSAHLISTLTFDTIEDLLWVGSCSVGITFPPKTFFWYPAYVPIVLSPGSLSDSMEGLPLFVLWRRVTEIYSPPCACSSRRGNFSNPCT